MWMNISFHVKGILFHITKIIYVENDSFKIFFDAIQKILKRFLPIHMSMLTYSLLIACLSQPHFGQVWG